jgi:hypothetical protein
MLYRNSTPHSKLLLIQSLLDKVMAQGAKADPDLQARGISSWVWYRLLPFAKNRSVQRWFGFEKILGAFDPQVDILRRTKPANETWGAKNLPVLLGLGAASVAAPRFRVHYACNK